MRERPSIVLFALFALLTLTLLALPACSDDGGSGANGTSDIGGDTSRDQADDSATAGCSAGDDCGTGRVCDPDLAQCVAICLSDTDCARTERCDVGNGLCLGRTPCDETAQCGATEACNTCLGVCVDSTGGAFCLEDVNCPDFDQFCDACLQECRPSLSFCEPCIEDRECGDAADLCLTDARGNRFCGGGCGPGLPPCPTGAACDNDAGQCLPLTGDCLRISECEGDVDCTGAQICAPSGICIDGCTEDGACPSDRVCNGGRCELGCTSTAECIGEQECEDGRCREPGSCVTSWDCPSAEMFCDRDTAMCVDGCQVDDDCRTFSLICRDGACIPRGCRGNYSCAFGQVCDLETGVCGEPTEPHCSTCNGDDLDSCGEANVCVNLQDEDGNDQGAFCFIACSDDPDNPCPQAYECTEIEIQQQGGGTEVRRVCARACYRTPV